MSILQKQKSRAPDAGYARDFVEMIGRILPDIVEKNIRVVANAGGLNPPACRRAVLAIAEQQGVSVKVATVTGDDIYGRLDELAGRGHEFLNMDTGRPLSDVRSRVRSANAYLGAFPIAQALNRGAQIVITGRCADAALALGPMIHEFGWGPRDWDRLAAGVVGGHVIECGAQATGGNCQVDWETIPNLADIGYPILEVKPDGTFVFTKHKGTGGRITVASTKEQLLYEVGDPRCYYTPDVIADFTTIQMTQAGEDRVAFSGIKGRPASDTYKVSISFSDGFKATGSVGYAWPDAYRKAQAGNRILRARLDRLGLNFDAVRSELLGISGIHGAIPSAVPDEATAAQAPEVILRFGVRAHDKAAVERFTKEIAPLVLSGPPSVTGLGGGRPKVEEVIAYWPTLLPKNEVTPEVHL